MAEGSISCEGLTTQVLDRIKQQDNQLHAFVHVVRQRALEAARKIDEAGANASPTKSLLGIPIAIKDLFDIEDLPTRAGSLSTTETPAQSTAFCVQKLIDAGSIIIGKTHTVEFAFGGWGTNSVMGTPWNPWDRETHRVPGGSSSGSAVAVASGMALAALGTDTGGSVRTPASYCGLVGTKTSSGLVSKRGVFPLCPTHDTVGTLTRTVRDAALLLSVVSGHDPEDEGTLGAPDLDFISSLEDGVEGLKIGVLDRDELSAASADIIELFEQSLGTFSNAGASLETHKLPKSLRSYLDEGGRLMSAESYSSLGEMVEHENSPVAAEIQARVHAGASISKDDYLKMLEHRQTAQEVFLSRFEGFDALIMPTCSSTAIPVADVDETAIVTPFGRFVNYLDLAAVSVPMGLCRDGLPAGLQIIVRKYHDALALQIAQVIEKVVGIKVR
jgi:aspartyl-tRNA(Asn)/glutamyl-tRNA(Gln) amidotransferase subunit A